MSRLLEELNEVLDSIGNSEEALRANLFDLKICFEYTECRTPGLYKIEQFEYAGKYYINLYLDAFLLESEYNEFRFNCSFYKDVFFIVTSNTHNISEISSIEKYENIYFKDLSLKLKFYRYDMPSLVNTYLNDFVNSNMIFEGTFINIIIDNKEFNLSMVYDWLMNKYKSKVNCQRKIIYTCCSCVESPIDFVEKLEGHLAYLKKRKYFSKKAINGLKLVIMIDFNYQTHFYEILKSMEKQFKKYYEEVDVIFA